MSTDLARETAAGYAGRLRAFLEGEDEDMREEFGDDYGMSATDWCGDSVLDVRRVYGFDGRLAAVELLVGFGGPNVWAVFDGRGCEFRVSWYCDPVTEWVECPDLSADTLELFDTWMVTQ